MSKHPYEDYEGTKLWNTIWECIDKLSKNSDIREYSQRIYSRLYL